MPVPCCPQCGALRDGVTTDPYARCGSCGALLADGVASRTLVARARFEAHEARLKVARALSGRGRAWVPGVPERVLLAFAATGDPRHPFRPLSALPPLLGVGWRPAGSDLASEPHAGFAAGEPGGDGGPRAAVSHALPAEALVVHYPLYRVPLVQGDFVSAAWCDGVDGRVVLPPELAESRGTGNARHLGRWVALAAAIGLAGGLLLPFPLSALGVAAGGVVLWRVARRR